MCSASGEISDSVGGLLPGECGATLSGVLSLGEAGPSGGVALESRGWGGGGTYQGLMGLVTRERQKSVCRSRRRHSHSIWPEPWPWRLELTTNLSR